MIIDRESLAKKKKTNNFFFSQRQKAHIDEAPIGEKNKKNGGKLSWNDPDDFYWLPRLVLFSDKMR